LTNTPWPNGRSRCRRGNFHRGTIRQRRIRIGQRFWDHSPGGYSLWAVIVAEVVLTGVFLLVILGSTDDRAPKRFAGLSIGLTLTLIHLISIPISNTSVNPARSTGVAFFNGDGAPAQLWVFWLAPLLGAAIAGIAYPYLFGRNEELADRPVRDDALEEPATT
jgi:aquaporin Z